jgi:hypothetical protein
MTITRDRVNRTIELAQERLTADLLDKYGMPGGQAAEHPAQPPTSS